MQVRFADSKLDRLETDQNYSAGFAAPIVRAFRKVLNAIRTATDERDIRAMRSLNFEKLKGSRSHQMSMRLNDQWRLIVEIESTKPKNIVIVISIEDYH